MINLTFEEIAQLRSQLADNSMAMECLDLIEECDGNVEDAAITMALRFGLEPDTSDRWLESLAKGYRGIICHPEVRDGFSNETLPGRFKGNVIALSHHLKASGICSPYLITPVVIFVLKQGLSNFCHPLDSVRI